jgi:hypothetical protein
MNKAFALVLLFAATPALADSLWPDAMQHAKTCAGSTEAGNTAWKDYDHRRPSIGLYVDINLSDCGFSQAPLVFINVHGNNHTWELTGTASAYDLFSKGFKVYVKFPDDRTAKQIKLSPQLANDYRWQVQWLAIEPQAGAK